MAKTPSTQKYLDISEIKNDCLVLNNGNLCGIILASSVNFALKSDEEQKAVIQAYVNFLNSLEYPLEILIQSRPFNIKPYLSYLDNLKKEQYNELLKSQMADYIDFVRELVDLGEIMTRRFYLVVPYNPLGDKKRNFFARLSDVFSAVAIVKHKREKFEKYRESLFQRMDNIISALSSMGIKSQPLDTQSLIELFYNTYSPAESENQPLSELDKLRINK